MRGWGARIKKMGLDELSQTPSIINNDDGGIQNVLCALYPSLERFPEMNLCNVAFLFLLIKLRLHCIHQVILDFPLSPSVCLSVSFSHLAHTVFNLSANPTGWYSQSVSEFIHFSSSPHSPSWSCYAHLLLRQSQQPPPWCSLPP